MSKLPSLTRKLNNSSYVETNDSRVEAEQSLFNYKVLYTAMAVFSGSYGILSFSFERYLAMQLTGYSLYEQRMITSIFRIFWVTKALFGLLADKIYPFRYRFKSYVMICGTFTILTVVAFYIIHSKFFHKHEQDDTERAEEFWLFFPVTLLLMLGIVLVDSVAQGITTIMIDIEMRVEMLKNSNVHEVDIMIDPKTKRFAYDANLKYSKNFSYYISIECLVACTGILISGILYDRRMYHPGLSDLDKDSFFAESMLFTGLYMLLPMLVFLWFKELKQTGWRSQKERLPFSSVIPSVSRNKWLILVVFLISMNPVNYDYDLVLGLIRRKMEIDKSSDIESKMNTYAVANVVAGLAFVLFVVIINRWCRSFRMKEYYYIIIITSLQVTGCFIVFAFSWWGWQNDWILFLYVCEVCIASVAGLRLTMVILADRLTPYLPVGHEVFLTNCFTSLVWLGSNLSGLNAINLRYLFGLLDLAAKADYSEPNFRHYAISNFGYTILTILAYFVLCHKSAPSRTSRAVSVLYTSTRDSRNGEHDQRDNLHANSES